MSVDQMTAAWAVSDGRSQKSICLDPTEWGEARVVYLFGTIVDWEVLRRWLHGGDRYAVCFGDRPVPWSHPRLRQGLLCEEGLTAQAVYTCLLPYYCVGLSDWAERMRHVRMTQDSLAVKMLALNTHFYPHFYHNLRHLPGALHGASLYGKFTGIPAVICGAGPSLDRVMCRLRPLMRSAMIIGCGSALTAMTRAGVTPHLGVGFSSSDEEARRFSNADTWEFPLAYRLRLNRYAHAQIKGPRIYTNGSCGLGIVRWVEEQLGIAGNELEEGPSVVHLATDFALQMRCDPIIYVGLDLAYTRDCSYADGVGAEDDGRRIWTTDIEGRPIQTKAPWLTEAQVLGKAIATCSHTQFLNATGGGIGIPGVSNGELPSWPERDVILKPDPMPHVTDSAVISVLQTLRESLRHSLGALAVLAVRDDVVSEVELSMELAYQKILVPMMEFRRHYMNRVYDRIADSDAIAREMWQWLLQEGQKNLNLLESNL